MYTRLVVGNTCNTHTNKALLVYTTAGTDWKTQKGTTGQQTETGRYWQHYHDTLKKV